MITIRAIPTGTDSFPRVQSYDVTIEIAGKMLRITDIDPTNISYDFVQLGDHVPVELKDCQTVQIT